MNEQPQNQSNPGPTTQLQGQPPPVQPPLSETEPTNPWGVLWRFLKEFFANKKFRATVLRSVFVLAFGLAIIFFVVVVPGYFTMRHYGYDFQSSFPFLKYSVEGMQTGALVDTIQAGINRNKDFALESVTELVRITDVTNAIGGKINTNRLVSIRIVYNLRALKDISSKEQTTFGEVYTSPFCQELRYWPGTDVECSRSGGGMYGANHYFTNQFVKYDVFFNVRKGDLHTIITGADEVLQLPMPDRRYRDIVLGGYEDVALYPNDDDVISELTIVVESDTVHLDPIRPMRFGLGESAPVEDGEMKFGLSGDPNDKLHPITRVISARWRKVVPGEKVALKYDWND